MIAGPLEPFTVVEQAPLLVLLDADFVKLVRFGRAVTCGSFGPGRFGVGELLLEALPLGLVAVEAARVAGPVGGRNVADF